MINEAVILAAGKASRMQTAEDEKIRNTPKPLLEVDGKPIIEYQIEKMIEAGINKIIIVVNPEKESMFREKLSKYNLVFCNQQERLGTAHALYCAKNQIKNDLFLVTMGDDKIVHNFRQLLELNQPTVCGYEVDDVKNFGSIKLKNENVGKILEKSEIGKGLANTGVYLMPRRFFDIFSKVPRRENGEYYLTDAVNLLTESGTRFTVFKLDFWMGINYPEDLTKAGG